jgi:hypothetical protein
LTVSTTTANSPFLVGVSGHRDLAVEDVPGLRTAITSFVDMLRQKLPDTELRIIVGMAEGADLLVAQTALDLGVRVEAVLPMPAEQYAQDFDGTTLKLLNELLERPDVHCNILSTPPGVGAGPHSPAQRDLMYANLTHALVRRSGLLLALWDGAVSPLPGGTADTVLRFLGLRNDDDAGPQTLEFVVAPSDLEWPEQLVYWAPAARSGAALPVGAHPPCFVMASGSNLICMQQEMPRRLEHQLGQLNNYNYEFEQLMSSGRLAVGDSLLKALPPECPVKGRPMLRVIDAQYAKADALAVYYQKRSDRLFDLFAVSAFAMGLAYLIYERITESKLLLITYMVILLLSLGLYYLLAGRHWFAKHLSYRALAETMRAKFYLRLAGADHRVDATGVLALSGIERFHGFGWMSYVLKGIEPPDIRVSPARMHAAQQAQCVEKGWIESQYRYFTSKVRQLEQSSRHVKRLRNALFVVIIIVIVGLFLFSEALNRIHMGSELTLRNLMLFVMGFLAVLLGVWELHQNKMATRELLWQYRNQLIHFTRARLQLERITTTGGRIGVLAELGKNSLMESYLWAIHRYHREHEPPAAR